MNLAIIGDTLVKFTAEMRPWGPPIDQDGRESRKCGEWVVLAAAVSHVDAALSGPL